MYKDLTTKESVVLDTSTSPVIEGKPISRIYDVGFRNGGVSIIGKFEGDTDKQWSTMLTREELPEAAQALYDTVITTVNAMHLSIRKSDANYQTDKWVEYVEPTEGD